MAAHVSKTALLVWFRAVDEAEAAVRRATGMGPGAGSAEAGWSSDNGIGLASQQVSELAG